MGETPIRETGATGSAVFSIRWALAAAFGVIALAGAAALVLALQSGRQNTIELVRDRTERIMSRIVERTRLHLDPVREQSEFLARLIAKGDLNPAEKAEFGARLTTALAATPQVEALAFIDTDLRQFRIERQDGGSRIRTFDMFDTPGVREALDEARNVGHSTWGELVWSHRFRQPLVNLRTPLWHGDKFIGVLFATVTVAELSNFLAKSRAGHDTNAFILYGREYVVAHRALAQNPPQLGFDRPLPAVGDLGDPVLAAFWNPDREPGAASVLTGGSRGHVVAVGEVPYVFVYRELAGYSDRPWLIGRYFQLDELEIEVRRLARAAWIGLGIFLAAVAGAWLAGRAIGRPIQRLARATAAIRSLDLAEARPLDSSRFREIDQATAAYNSLLSAMRWFETYVPRSLVLRLMARGDEAPALEERVVTVLFTDIVGFTPLAENLSAQAIAEFLNHHFELIAECVEAEGGTIDKFIGDAVMAFWGAPEPQADHAIRACRSARAIAACIATENRERQNRGAAPVKVRIGVHTGPVIVGNIGAPGRINYTVIGDTVNIAERLEELAREYMTSDDEVVALASEATLVGLDTVASAESVGRHTLRGRREAIEVYRVA